MNFEFGASIAHAVRDGKLWLLFLSLQIPSLRALFKYVPAAWWPLIPIYLTVTWLLYADLLHNGLAARLLKRLTTRGWLLLLLLLALFVIQMIVYPQADALKYAGRGTPQDDALVVGGEYLANGLNPYEALTYRREYVSAGPGWILLALPFTLTGTIGLFNPVWLAITALVFWRLRKDAYHASRFLILLMSSLAFWEMTVSGSDMISIGCALLVSAVCVQYVKQRGWGMKIPALILTALVATSRIVFAYAIPLLAGFLWKRDRKQSLLFLFFAGGLTAGLHLFFYLWNPAAYFPLHRFSDPSFLPGIAWPLIAALASLIMLIGAIRRVRDKLESWLFNFWLALAVVMFFSAFGDLAARSFSLAEWEGANYLGVVMPLFVAWLILEQPSHESTNHRLSS